MDMTAKISDEMPSIATVQIEKEDGEVVKKDILFSDFLNLLNRAKGMENSYCRLGQLPVGFYDGAISQIYDQTFKTIIIVNQQRLPCKYFESEYIIPYPKSAFFFDIYKKKVVDTKVFALKQHNGKGDHEQLCQFPFPNIYADGRICWGKNKLPQMQQMKDTEQLISLFFSTPFNQDLFGESRGKWNSIGSTVLEILETLQVMDTFPESVLVPCNGITLDNLLQ